MGNECQTCVKDNDSQREGRNMVGLKRRPVC